MEIEGKKVVVVGGASGMARAAAVRPRERGASIAVLDLPTSKGAEAADAKDAAFPKRMGRPDEYARLAVAIVENPMLNGSTVRLDAGQRFAPK